MSPEGAAEKQKRRSASRLRATAFRLSVLAVVALTLSGYVAYRNIADARFLPPPASTVGVEPALDWWPMFRRDAGHSASVAAGASPLRGQETWAFAMAAPLISPPAVTQHAVYVATGDGRIVALDSGTGEPIWEDAVRGAVSTSPAIAGGFVYTGLRDGRVIAIRVVDGSLAWETDIGDFVHSSPLVINGVLYAGSGDSRIYALDASTGEVRWRYRTGKWVTSSPAATGEGVVVISEDGYLYVMDSRKGKPSMDYRVGSEAGNPATNGSIAFVRDARGSIVAIDTTTGDPLFEKLVGRVRVQLLLWGILRSVSPELGFVWIKTLASDAFAGDPAVGLDRVFAVTRGGAVYALDAATGAEVWHLKAETGLSASPILVGDNIYVVDRNGILYLLDARTGEERWRVALGAGVSVSPVYAQGTLYVATDDGRLRALE